MTDTSRLDRFRRMAAMRAFDEACLDALRRGEIHGELHIGFGQEAVGAGLSEACQPIDAVVSTHRNHFHGLAKGVDPRAFLAEIMEKDSGLCRGRGGHMHPFDPGTNFSATGIVGASLPVALGYAYGYRLRRQHGVAFGITGDGGSHTGGFHETLVMAGAMKLPLVALVENNALAISVSFASVSPTRTISERALAYGARGILVDGTDVDAVADALRAASDHARNGGGPVIVEATCHRFRGHFEGDPDTYRDREEKQRIRDRYDPIALYRTKLLAQGVASDTLAAIASEESGKMKAILASVRLDRQPHPSTALEHNFVSESAS